MPSTLTKIYIQIVFAVKGRFPAIPPSWFNKLHSYIAGTINSVGHKCIIVGGTENHVHILIEYNITKSLPDLVKTIKVASTNYINQNRIFMGHFYWQRGYAAFSYSKSAVPDVIAYIKNQPAHHRIQTMEDELRKFLQKFEVRYEERYLFDD